MLEKRLNHLICLEISGDKGMAGIVNNRSNSIALLCYSAPEKGAWKSGRVLE
jgi:hypothetical protein